jgi:hypothetical protein
VAKDWKFIERKEYDPIPYKENKTRMYVVSIELEECKGERD